MSRKLKIISITGTTTVPGVIQVATDFTMVFQGKFYLDDAGSGSRLPFYTTPAPVGYSVVIATTFDIVGNTKYNGRYTVYTPTSAGDTPASSFSGGNTHINVNEIIPALSGGDAPSLASDGYVTNISTYMLTYSGGNLIIPPGVTDLNHPIAFMGRYVSGWGEGYAQNFMDLTTNFAASTAPANPFTGQVWFDTGAGQLKIWNGSSWGAVTGNVTSYTHTQSSSAATWTINHNLGLTSPYIATVDFYVDRGAGPKMIIPSDISFVNGNQLTVTFSNSEIGYAIVRK